MAGRLILVLGGTGEAVEIARHLHEPGQCTVMTSLAGVTENPVRPPGLLRSGGFGGARGLADFLCAEGVTAMIDATHPFADRISRNAAHAADLAEVPLLRLTRRAWSRTDEDLWYEVDSIDGAAAWLRDASLPDGASIFLTVGRTRIDAFRAIGRFRFLLRVIEAPDPAVLPPDYQIMLARGPFSESSERDLLRVRNIACLVTRNSGGNSGYAKIAAARSLAIPVLMITRPQTPTGHEAETIDDVLRWAEALVPPRPADP